MTDKRYFDTDPLAAAWMAKHFGMEFQRGDQCVIGWQDFVELEYCRWDAPFYINPDSLHLLEPKVGDFYLDDFGHGYRYSADDGDDFVRIIERNGIPFMWPECEAA